MVTLQLCLTAAIVVSMMRMKKRFDQLAAIAGCASLIAIVLLFLVQRIFPWNGLLFVFFTCCTGISVGNVCVIYQERQGANMVLRAFTMTMGIFIALTLFTMFSKTDWVFLGPFLFVGLIILMLEGTCSHLYGGKVTP